MKHYLTQRISATQGMNEGWARLHTDDRMDMRNTIHDFRNNFRKHTWSLSQIAKQLLRYCQMQTIKCEPTSGRI